MPKRFAPFETEEARQYVQDNKSAFKPSMRKLLLTAFNATQTMISNATITRHAADFNSPEHKRAIESVESGIAAQQELVRAVNREARPQTKRK